MKKYIFLLIVLLSFFFVGCSSKPSLEVTKNEITIFIDEEYQINYFLKNADEAEVYFYSTSDQIIELSEDGIIKGLKEGSCEVLVLVTNYPKLEQVITVHVEEDLENKVVDPDEQLIIKGRQLVVLGETITIEAIDLLDTGYGVFFRALTPEIATITNEGVVKGISLGIAVFRVMSRENANELEFTVRVENQLVALGPEVVLEGEQITYTAIDRLATNKGIEWKALTPELATIDENGLIKGLEIGIARFELKSLENGKTLEFKVLVRGVATVEFKRELDQLFEGQVMGAQVVAYNNGEIIKYNYGLASQSSGIPITDESIFRIASISKIVIAMSALKLIEEGKLNLDDDIGDILGYPVRNPYFPDDKITVKMLMVHSATIMDGKYNEINGQHSYVPLADLLYNTSSQYYSTATFGNYKPGTKFSYSNFGSGILACVVEKASGEHFTNYVRDNFMIPLGIDGGFKANEIKNKHLITDAYYYNATTKVYTLAVSGNGFVNGTYAHYTLGDNFRAHAGNLYVSMQDLAKIMIVLLNDGMYEDIEILKKDTVDLMLQTHFVTPPGTSASYKAKGLQLKIMNDINGITLKGHTGSAYGIVSEMFFSKELNQGVCFITNGGNIVDTRPGLDNMLEGVLKAFFNNFPKKENNLVDIDLTKATAMFNNRKIILEGFELRNNKIYVTLNDLSSLLNEPAIKAGTSYFFMNKLVEFEDGKIDLCAFLDKANIEYLLTNNKLKYNLIR